MDASGSKKFLRLPEVLARVGVSARTLRRWYAASKFPLPIFLGNGRVPAWLESDLDVWEARTIATRPYKWRHSYGRVLITRKASKKARKIKGKNN